MTVIVNLFLGDKPPSIQKTPYKKPLASAKTLPPPLKPTAKRGPGRPRKNLNSYKTQEISYGLTTQPQYNHRHCTSESE